MKLFDQILVTIKIKHGFSTGENLNGLLDSNIKVVRQKVPT